MESQTMERMRQDYVANRVLSAHPVEVVAMLFGVAISALNEAISHLRSGDRFARSKAVTKAEQAIHELSFALDHSVAPSFSRRTEGVYRYALGRIVAGHAQESEAAFQEALEVLRPLESAWSEVRAGIVAEPKSAEEPAEDRAEEPAVKDPYAAYRPEVAGSSRDWSC